MGRSKTATKSNNGDDTMPVNTKGFPLRPLAAASVMFSTIAGLTGCGSSDNDNSNTSQAAAEARLSCDDSIKTGFKPDTNTSVLLVKAFKRATRCCFPAPQRQRRRPQATMSAWLN
jgi:hypothetical protein